MTAFFFSFWVDGSDLRGSSFLWSCWRANVVCSNLAKEKYTICWYDIDLKSYMQNTETNDQHKRADWTQTNRESTSLFSRQTCSLHLNGESEGKIVILMELHFRVEPPECSFFSSRPPIHSICSCWWMLSLSKSLRCVQVTHLYPDVKCWK